MANGGKKKNKKSEESVKKEQSEEDRLREQQAKKERVLANLDKARRERDQQRAIEQMASSLKKKEGENNEGKRAADNKRRDSLGGSVSTSSNSSGTDTDEVLSEANKSAITSPHNEKAVESQASGRIHIADAISSIHQVAQSVVAAGTEDALYTLGEFLPYTMPTKNKKNKAGARHLATSKAQAAGETTEVSALSPSPSPSAPRQVVTPILNGGTTTPSAEAAAFRSISDDHPGEMPGATPTMETDRMVWDDKPEKPARSSPLSPVSPMQKEKIQPYRGAHGTFPMLRADYGAKDAFFHDLVRQSFVHSITDPICAENGQFNHVYGRPEFATYERGITCEKVHENPDAYKSALKGGKAAPERLDMVAVHETSVRQESEGLWLRGERSVLKNIYDDIPKLLAKQKEPYIRDLLQMVFEGRPKKVSHRMRVMVNMLRRQDKFKKATDAEIYTHIAKTLLEAGTNAEMGYSYVHVLAAQGNGQKMCAEEGHRKCMTLQLMLGPLLPESLQKALSLKAREWRHRTPIHFATATGQPCQLDALQKFNADCTTPDELGATPVLYAVIRDNLLMLRQLAWYGADTMQTCDRLGHTVLDWNNVTGKFPLGKTCKEFIIMRNLAFERILRTWMSEITQSVTIKKGLSEMHTLDCRQPSEHVIENIHIKNEVVTIPHWIGHINKTVHLKLRSNVSHDDRSSMFLLIIPFTYCTADENSPADRPEIVRRSLFVEEDDRLRPVQFITANPFINVKDPLSTRPPLQKALVPLLMQPNTGTFWAYKIPSDVFSNECIWVTLSLDLLKVDVVLRENLRLLIQVVSLQPKPQQPY